MPFIPKSALAEARTEGTFKSQGNLVLAAPSGDRHLSSTPKPKSGLAFKALSNRQTISFWVSIQLNERKAADELFYRI